MLMFRWPWLIWSMASETSAYCTPTNKSCHAQMSHVKRQWVCMNMYVYIYMSSLHIHIWVMSHVTRWLKFLSTNSDQTKISMWICTARYQEIWVSGLGGFQGCSNFSGNCQKYMSFYTTQVTLSDVTQWVMSHSEWHHGEWRHSESQWQIIVSSEALTMRHTLGMHRALQQWLESQILVTNFSHCNSMRHTRVMHRVLQHTNGCIDMIYYVLDGLSLYRPRHTHGV